MVGQDKDRNLVFFGNLEGMGGDVETLLGVAGCKDSPGEFAVPGIEGVFQDGLLGPGGQSGSWRRPLAQGNDNGCFGHSGQGQSFDHQGESAAGSGGHGSDPGVRRAQRHIDGRNLVFGLFHHHAHLFRGVGHIIQDAGGRGHRITGIKFTAGGQRA